MKKGKGKKKRFHWLVTQIKEHGFTVGAEIGVFRGITMAHILKRCPRLKQMYAVDLWEFRPDILSDRSIRLQYQQEQEHNYATYNQRTAGLKDRIIELRGVSWEMADKVADASLDFIFIDADHGYDAVKKDIQAWVPKVREGGLIAGHDINLPGVYQAVQELIPDSRVAGVDNCWFAWKKKS